MPIRNHRHRVVLFFVRSGTRETYATAETLDARATRWLDAMEGLPGRRPLPAILMGAILLLVDLQRLFLDPLSPAFLPTWHAVAPRCRSLLDAFRSAGLPVCWTRHTHPPEDAGGIITHFGGRLQTDSDPLTQFAAGWDPLPGELMLEKSRYSVCSNPQWMEFFAPGALVVLAGVTTHRCILASALELAMRDCIPIVAADATASLNESLHRQSLGALASGFAHVVSCAEILTALPCAEVKS